MVFNMSLFFSIPMLPLCKIGNSSRLALRSIWDTVWLGVDSEGVERGAVGWPWDVRAVES